jgi:hypothetical protein
MEIPTRTTFILTDTINRAYIGWMHEDLETSFNLASLALWRADTKKLWVTQDEERFLRVAVNHPPESRV